MCYSFLPSLFLPFIGGGESEDLQINNAASGCSYYWMDISGRASENRGGFDVGLDSIAIRSGWEKL